VAWCSSCRTTTCAREQRSTRSKSRNCWSERRLRGSDRNNASAPWERRNQCVGSVGATEKWSG
jgi:hypothetical protein